MITQKETIWHAVGGAVLQGIIWGAPILLTTFPHLGDLTISAIIGSLVAWAHIKYLTY